MTILLLPVIGILGLAFTSCIEWILDQFGKFRNQESL